jgi:hypothetical protein
LAVQAPHTAHRHDAGCGGIGADRAALKARSAAPRAATRHCWTILRMVPSPPRRIFDQQRHPSHAENLFH